jgi:hypothetical protein
MVTMTPHRSMRGHRYRDHMVVCMKYEGSSLLWSYGCLYEIWEVIVTMIIWLSVWNMRGHCYHDHMVVCMKYERSSLPWSYGCLYEIWGVIVTMIIWLSVWNMRGHRYHDHMVVCMKYEGSSWLWSYACLYAMTPHISYRQPYDHGNDDPSYFIQTTIWSW